MDEEGSPGLGVRVGKKEHSSQKVQPRKADPVGRRGGEGGGKEPGCCKEEEEWGGGAGRRVVLAGRKTCSQEEGARCHRGRGGWLPDSTFFKTDSYSTGVKHEAH